MAQHNSKVVGVMGGMGPGATVDFMAKVIALTDADKDQDHVHMIVDNDPTIPNRQRAISRQADDVSAPLAVMAKRLENAGADFLVLVCNTAHVFLDDMRVTIGIPFVSIVNESVAEIDRVIPEAQAIGVMATTGCLQTNIYQDAIAASGRSAIIPTSENQRRCMELIDAIKAGDESLGVAQAMEDIAAGLQRSGAEALIAGCTEIPLVFGGSDFPLPVLSSTDILAKRTVELATGAKLSK